MKDQEANVSSICLKLNTEKIAAKLRIVSIRRPAMTKAGNSNPKQTHILAAVVILGDQERFSFKNAD